MEAHDTFTIEMLAIQRRLFAYILTLVPNLADADDVLQETNAVLLRKREEFQAGTSLAAWACQVAYLEILACRKRQARWRHALNNDDLLAQLSSEATAKFEAVDNRLAALEICLQKLPAADRDLVRMRYRQELSSQGMADRLARTAESVRRHLYRIRVALLRCIERQIKKET